MYTIIVICQLKFNYCSYKCANIVILVIICDYHPIPTLSINVNEPHLASIPAPAKTNKATRPEPGVQFVPRVPYILISTNSISMKWNSLKWPASALVNHRLRMIIHDYPMACYGFLGKKLCFKSGKKNIKTSLIYQRRSVVGRRPSANTCPWNQCAAGRSTARRWRWESKCWGLGSLGATRTHHQIYAIPMPSLSMKSEVTSV
jgi:hypothetical protein